MLEMAEFIEELRCEESKEKYITASYTAWQMAGTGKTFKHYLRGLGLTMRGDEPEKLTDNQKKIILDDINKKVDKIMRIKKVKKKRIKISA